MYVLDILIFVLVGSIGQCVDDSFVVAAPGGPGSPLICGSNSGYHSKYLITFITREHSYVTSDLWVGR